MWSWCCEWWFGAVFHCKVLSVQILLISWQKINFFGCDVQQVFVVVLVIGSQNLHQFRKERTKLPFAIMSIFLQCFGDWTCHFDVCRSVPWHPKKHESVRFVILVDSKQKRKRKRKKKSLCCSCCVWTRFGCCLNAHGVVLSDLKGVFEFLRIVKLKSSMSHWHFLVLYWVRSHFFHQNEQFQCSKGWSTFFEKSNFAFWVCPGPRVIASLTSGMDGFVLKYQWKFEWK